MMTIEALEGIDAIPEWGSPPQPGTYGVNTLARAIFLARHSKGKHGPWGYTLTIDGLLALADAIGLDSEVGR